MGFIGYSDRLIKQWINKYAGEMKRGERRKDVWYRCKQGGEEMTDEMVMIKNRSYWIIKLLIS